METFLPWQKWHSVTPEEMEKSNTELRTFNYKITINFTFWSIGEEQEKPIARHQTKTRRGLYGQMRAQCSCSWRGSIWYIATMYEDSHKPIFRNSTPAEKVTLHYFYLLYSTQFSNAKVFEQPFLMKDIGFPQVSDNSLRQMLVPPSGTIFVLFQKKNVRILTNSTFSNLRHFAWGYKKGAKFAVFWRLQLCQTAPRRLRMERNIWKWK